MLKTIKFITAILLVCNCCFAAPPQSSPHIKIDQFGYFPNARKVAVIVDPQAGYNANESFTPGTGQNQYQVRRWSDDVVVYAGTLQSWNGGATHVQSGDRGWWFDFSALTTPGSYYIFDLANSVASFQFEIGENVYEEALRQAMRTFFYQRINFAKQQPYTDAKWADAACYDGPGQDRYATSRFAKGDLTTVRDLHGGWMDAGDFNKYTTFASNAVIQLMEAYRMNPSAFKDNYNIPESGNGIPDILDEVKWELDFLKRMQDATGTNGFMLKVGVDNFNEVTPPSTDKRPRYYLPECTSATLCGASMFSVAGMAMQTEQALAAYSQDLIRRAELAWARAKVTTQNFTTWQTACDDGDIKSGDADIGTDKQLDHAFIAAVYLYEATGKAEYKLFAESQYFNVTPYRQNWWGPYTIPQQLALLRFTTLPNISTVVASSIRSRKQNMEYLYSIRTYTSSTDLYRAHMNDETYHWGHNEARTNAGSMNLDYITFNLNETKHPQYQEVAEQYLHWMHGVNPMGMVMLTNMYQYGAEKCANEIFHSWYKNGSSWDNALYSTNGPAPGYVPGGPNKQYSGSAAEISNQPHQKAYKDWNSGGTDKSWEVTEPAIYYQASYVMLLSRLMPAVATTKDSVSPTAPGAVAAINVTANNLTLKWLPATDDVQVTGYDVYRNDSLLQAGVTDTSLFVKGLVCGTDYDFWVVAKDASGNRSPSSDSATAHTSDCPTIVTSFIYQDILDADWMDVSTASVRNYANTTFFTEGAKSIRVDFSGNGTLAFEHDSAVTTTAATQLKFWVYNNSKNTFLVNTQSFNGTQSTAVSLKPASSKWTPVSVSMAQLGNPSSIKKIVIKNNSAKQATMYFDNIQISNVTEPQMVPMQMAASRLNMAQTISATHSPGLQVYPNPVREHLNFVLQSDIATGATIQLINLDGKVVLQQFNFISKGNHHQKLPVGKLVKGVYLLKITTAGQTWVRKIIKR
ncbi:glycoside hydrolase family 9 protein [Paracnuella aquatica]|uniref:glycoside hydrolase family 9 protein n=1 Tax=Paracnuella aquatica TaxID=2268757 RepID=UPI000DEFB811|nr:glycoside hydrolase family 9 protein [Paracnuella aquatica]RPD47267.1 T9SS C-terminal target domain-containing protein [Paracnuella aquatica]